MLLLSKALAAMADTACALGSELQIFHSEVETILNLSLKILGKTKSRQSNEARVPSQKKMDIS